ncbi:hypothetical protein J1N35_014242 [Gossypium stocksii]|uniref:Uncharacterized protein n=1 Tax=Gossypium stocksii TaxID=47602 RepID=A0A9D3VW58_9ROSI|nr:hypothetical protein J1N35_014242 [Gossypium stocksii]
MSPTPLLIILNENKLNGDNFQEWKQNLLVVLNSRMSSVLQKQHKNFRTAKEIMMHLEDLLRSQVALAQQSTITNLMNSQQKPDTLVKEHMLKLMRFFVEVEDNGA